MNVSRHFIIIVIVLLVIAGGAYYFLTRATFPEKRSEDSLSMLDVYLNKNFFFTLNLNKDVEENLRIACATRSIEENPDTLVAYPCQNENPSHKVVVGWASTDKTYMGTVESLMNEQLFWKGRTETTVTTGDVFCKEREDYPYYYYIVYGMDCNTVTSEGEVLYSSIFFLQPKELIGKKAFVAVLNTSKQSNFQQTSNELLALVIKLKKYPVEIGIKQFFAAVPKLTNNSAGIASSTSELSVEATLTSPTNSINTPTAFSGEDIDATVCDVIDVSKCYPLYCQTTTAVWNYSLSKCVEPNPTLTPSASVSRECPQETPVWDGSKCRVLSGTIIPDGSCSIPVGGDACDMNIFWSATSTEGKVEVLLRQETETLVLGFGLTGTIQHRFVYQEAPYVVDINDRTGKLNSGKFSTTCSSGGFDVTTKKCVDPQVEKIDILGEYYASPGTMNVTCTNADRFYVRSSDTATIVASGTYTGVASAPLQTTGNYAAVCALGEYESLPSVTYYHAPPAPAPTLSLLISPRTLSKNQEAKINWKIQYPMDSCKLEIIAVCKNGTDCTTSQVDFENKVNELLQTEMTDSSDPDTSRPISEAVRTSTPSSINKTWIASGQKTIAFSETSDVILSCGKEKIEKKRVYIRAGAQRNIQQEQ